MVSIWFYAIQGVSSTVDMDLPNFACRAAPGEAGYDDDDEAAPSSSVTGSSQKRKMCAIQQHVDINKKKLKVQTDTIDLMRKVFSSKMNSENPIATSAAEESELQATNSLLAQLAALEKQRHEMIALVGQESQTVQIFDEQISHIFKSRLL